MSAKNNNGYFLFGYLLFFMMVIVPISSQTNVKSNFQLTPGQRSLPDIIPQDEYIYIPEGQTNDPMPSLDLHATPPSSDIDIPPMSPKIDEFLLDKEPIDIVSPPDAQALSRNDGQDVAPNQYPSDSPDRATFSVMPENAEDMDVPKDAGILESNPSAIYTYEKPNVPVTEPENTFLVEKITPQYVPLDIPSGVVSEPPHGDVVSVQPSEFEGADPKKDGIVENSAQTYIASQPTDVSREIKGEMSLISVLSTGMYIQIISYNKLPSTDILVNNQIIAAANMRERLQVYKAVHSKYYRVLIGPFSSSEVGVELLRWRKNGFDDAYVVYGKGS